MQRCTVLNCGRKCGLLQGSSLGRVRGSPAAAFSVPSAEQLSVRVSPADSCPHTTRPGDSIARVPCHRSIRAKPQELFIEISLLQQIYEYVHTRISEPELDFLSLTASSSPLLSILLKNMTCTLSDCSRVTSGYWKRNMKGLRAQGSVVQ